MNRRIMAASACAIVSCMALLLAGCARSQEPPPPARKGGLSPEEAVARMHLAPGFTATVFASEPDIRQPVAMNWDDRGRLWVVEYIQYPDPAGLKALEWDRYFRTRYDRVPEPPPRGPRGADRIRILEDTDRDGKADRFRTFISGLNLATGVAVGYGGVYVAQTPYLLFYPDRNQDDVPDGGPEILLEGFGMEDAHAVVNSLAWGPDGWLYGAQGSTVTARIRGHIFQQGIWRFHPVTKQFELFAEGGGNTWSFDWDADGHLLCGTNWGRYALLHLVQGGYYVKNFEKHGELSNRFAFGYFPHAEHRGPFKGGHVTIGGLTYQADAFPEPFRGKHVAANILSNAVYWFDIEPNGSTFATRLSGDLLVGNDEWFRPVDLTTGPDGALYVADWYDVRATHNNTREDNWDKGSGRIYRIDHGAGHRAPEIRLARESSERLLERLAHPNEWFHREARRVLGERRDASVIARLRASLTSEPSSHLALEYLWALYVSGGFDEALGRDLLDHPSDPVRMWAVRFLGDAQRVEGATLAKLEALAAKEPDVHVRSQLASSARRLPGPQAVRLLSTLIARDEDASDPHIPLLVWWGLERHMEGQRSAIVGMMQDARVWKHALVRSHLGGRLARRLASTGSEDDFADLAGLLAAAKGSEEVVLEGIDLGLAGRGLEKPPRPLTAALETLQKSGKRSPALLRVGARLGSESARRAVREMAASSATTAKERLPMIDLLGQLGGHAEMRILLDLFARGPDEAVRTESLKALGRFDDRKVAERILGALSGLGPALRERALHLLAGRKDWALELVRFMGPDFAREPATLVRGILAHEDSELRALVEKYWGKMHEGKSEKEERIRELSGFIGPVNLFSRPGRSFDKERGKAIYQERCAKCHTLFGDGQAIGPDLTAADRNNIDQLVANVIDPSASIRGEFASHNILFKDGRRLSGIILEPTPVSFVVLDAQAERTVVARAEVAEIRESSVSLMPENLIDDLDRQSIADFFFYLTGSGR